MGDKASQRNKFVFCDKVTYHFAIEPDSSLLEIDSFFQAWNFAVLEQAQEAFQVKP